MITFEMTILDLAAIVGLAAIVFYFLGLHSGCRIELIPLKGRGAVTLSRRKG